jgi:hypothetical protein
MKKLRMILTSVIVLAIVGGAFAFKTKVGAFCIKTGTTAGDCTTFKQLFKITTDTENGILYRYYPTWDGDPVECTRASNNKCLTQFRLTDNG